MMFIKYFRNVSQLDGLSFLFRLENILEINVDFFNSKVFILLSSALNVLYLVLWRGRNYCGCQLMLLKRLILHFIHQLLGFAVGARHRTGHYLFLLLIC
jgi:hypothetical protein